jgi:DNA-binding XRE family transcriptional regulator
MRLGPADLHHDGEDFHVARTLNALPHVLCDQARLELRHAGRQAPRSAEDIDAQAHAAVLAFGAALPGIRKRLDLDVIAAHQGDPAAHGVDEVLLCLPGVLPMIRHRRAHQLYLLELPLIARIVAELAHAQTGIDIHPGARIGDGFFIDHGTCVVIGETAVIGARVRIYQAVTLGEKRLCGRCAQAPAEGPAAPSGGGGRGGDLRRRDPPRARDDRVRRGRRQQRLDDRGRARRRQRDAGRRAEPRGGGGAITALVERFGIVVRQLRVRNGWTQDELAWCSGLDRSYVGEIERGGAVASIVTVEKFAAALHAGSRTCCNGFRSRPACTA